MMFSLRNRIVLILSVSVPVCLSSTLVLADSSDSSVQVKGIGFEVEGTKSMPANAKGTMDSGTLGVTTQSNILMVPNEGKNGAFLDASGKGALGIGAAKTISSSGETESKADFVGKGNVSLDLNFGGGPKLYSPCRFNAGLGGHVDVRATEGTASRVIVPSVIDADARFNIPLAFTCGWDGDKALLVMPYLGLGAKTSMGGYSHIGARMVAGFGSTLAATLDVIKRTSNDESTVEKQAKVNVSSKVFDKTWVGVDASVTQATKKSVDSTLLSPAAATEDKPHVVVGVALGGTFK